MGRAVGRYLLLVGAVIVLTFFLPRALPGDPLSTLGDAGDQSDTPMPAEAQQVMRGYYGLDRPLLAQLDAYLARLAHLDLGWSYALHRPVRALIAERFPYTAGLVGTSLLASGLLGVALGVASGWKAGTPFDRGLVAAILGISALPEFLVGMVLIVLFAVVWPILPAAGAGTPFLPVDSGAGAAVLWDRLRHFILPALALTAAGLPSFYYLTRSAIVPLLDAPYILAARAKGLSDTRVALRHAVPSAILPVASLFGIRVAFVAGGAIVIERLFSYPGIGQLMLQAVWMRDYPVIEGSFLVLSLSVLTVNFLMDAVAPRIDPRITGVP